MARVCLYIISINEVSDRNSEDLYRLFCILITLILEAKPNFPISLVKNMTWSES